MLFLFLLPTLSHFTLRYIHLCFSSHWGRYGVSPCGDTSFPVADSAEELLMWFNAGLCRDTD